VWAEEVAAESLDGEVPGVLGEPLDGLLFTCVGVPEYGRPPAARGGADRDRPVTPRVADQDA
jgi:hypothetical protein